MAKKIINFYLKKTIKYTRFFLNIFISNTKSKIDFLTARFFGPALFCSKV